MDEEFRSHTFILIALSTSVLSYPYRLPILQCLRHVLEADRVTIREISEGAGDFDGAVIGAR